jgi:eukaryotic-like serine/threonine-protein kinase
MAGECGSATSSLRQSYRGPAVSSRGFEACPASQGVEVEAALAFAMAGDTTRAESLAQDSGKRFPMDTQMQSLWLPAIQAQLALEKKNPARALNALQGASPVELGQIPFVPNISCLYHVYIRGEAYLAAGQGSAAAAEFQKILDHSGIVWNCWTGALAHLGVALRTLGNQEPHRERMPMLRGFGRSWPTKISSHSGKTPTPTSPS